MLSTPSGNVLPSSSRYVPQSQLQSTAPLAPWITSGADDVTSQEIYLPLQLLMQLPGGTTQQRSLQPCLRSLLLLPGQRERRERMTLAPVLSLRVSACPPSTALERAHPAHPRYCNNKFWFHWSENLGSYSSPICREGTGQHRARAAKCCQLEHSYTSGHRNPGGSICIAGV